MGRNYFIVGFRILHRLQKKWQNYLDYGNAPFIRLLWYSPIFRWSLLASCCVLVTIPFLLMRLWTVTPQHIDPPTRISVLDFIQASALRRSAERATEKSRLEEASHAWRSSIANHPAQLDALRAYLQFLGKSQGSHEEMREAVRIGLWLLQLNRTNQTDLDLVTMVWEQRGFHREVVQYASALDQPFSQQTQISFFKSAFHAFDFERCSELLKTLSPQVDQKDPEIPLYHMAYLAARGPIETVVQNHQALRCYYPDPQWQDLAHQLNCIVSAEREDLIDLQASITFLRNKGKLHFSQQLVYWQLLLDSTMLAELAADMRQFPPEPATVGEVVWFVELAMKAGLTDIARETLGQQAPLYAGTERLWLLLVSLLESNKQWNELREMAILVRQAAAQLSALKDLSLYMEARAAHADRRFGVADTLVSKMDLPGSASEPLSFALGKGLNEMGYETKAMQAIEPLTKQADWMDTMALWNLVFQMHVENGSRSWLLKAAENLYRLAPRNRNVLNNYAAVLLSERVRPGQALALTRENVQTSGPMAYHHLVNHAVALMLNGRLEEAHAFLRQVPSEKLPPDQLNSFYMAWFEYAYRTGQLARARSFALKLSPDRLLPGDVAFLNDALSKMAPDSQSGEVIAVPAELSTNPEPLLP